MKAGLTGGIASGKSTVAGFFNELGARVIDADRIAHRALLRPEVIRPLVARFGEGILTPEQAVDRRKLAQRVFEEDHTRTWLNALIHPLVREDIQRQLIELESSEPNRLVVVDVPLLIESDFPRRYGPVILAYCPAETQIERLKIRDRLSREEAWKRLRAQMPIAEKVEFADFIIDTSRGLDETRAQVRDLFLRLVPVPQR